MFLSLCFSAPSAPKFTLFTNLGNTKTPPPTLPPPSAFSSGNMLAAALFTIARATPGGDQTTPCASSRGNARKRPPNKTVRQFAQQAPHVSFWRKLYESGEYKRWLLYAVEAYGIFKIGEMVGRRHIVGYKLDESRTHALT